MLQVRKALETIRNTSNWTWPCKKAKGERTADGPWALIRAAMEDHASGAMHVDPGTKDYKYTQAEVEDAERHDRSSAVHHALTPGTPQPGPDTGCLQ
jgi:hypothetical protein